MADEPAEPSIPIPIARRAVLPYQGVAGTAVKTVRKFYDPIEAQLFANELAVNDIDYSLVNQNVTGLGLPYSGFSQIELQVRERDLEQATGLLSTLQVNPLEVEPENATDPHEPIPDPAGEGTLLAAGEYDNPRALFDAAATLGAARVECFIPTLVPRGQRPAGNGKRFILRVRASDEARAREILTQREADPDDDEPRCPRCGSYRVAAASRPWPGLVKFLMGGGSASPAEMECLRCKHRWPVPG